jgi:hypothetical protein
MGWMLKHPRALKYEGVVLMLMLLKSGRNKYPRGFPPIFLKIGEVQPNLDFSENSI